MRIASFAAALVLVALIGGCEASHRPDSGSGPPAMSVSPAALLPRHVSDLPPFDFPRYERLLYELRGAPVVVNLWASWCGPCRDEAPALVDAANRYGDRVQFLGVDFQDKAGDAAAFSRRYGVPYASISDPAGEIHDALGFVGLPDTLFYASDGTLVATWTGPLTKDAIRTNVERLLSSAGRGTQATAA
jgi:cytochrome c biogenesis protein CcmG, thiol:disulfide interchange protein DsbE